MRLCAPMMRRTESGFTRGARGGILRAMSGPFRRVGAALLWLLVAGCGGARDRSVAPPIAGPSGAPARTVDFELHDLEGRPVRLSDYRGRVVLVNYFATWCQPCLAEIPAFNRLARRDGSGPDLVVLGVSVDLQPDEVLRPFVEYMGIEYPVLVADTAMLNGRTPFGEVHAIPASFLVDPAGRHVESFLGPAPIDYVRRRAGELASGGR